MSPIRRVVFDTSTLVSAALRPGSVPHEALVHALGACGVCASEETLAELERVLRRKKFDRYLHAQSRGAFVDLMRRHLYLFTVEEADTADVKPLCRDFEDNKFLALALAAEADLVVSSDEDLLALHPWCGIPILTPMKFLRSPGTNPAAKENA